jgi:HEAT repeat protein
LATLADATIADDLVALLRNPKHGHSREMLCDALKRTGDPRAPDVLIQLLDDDEVAGHAIAALRSYGAKASVPHLLRAQGKLQQILGGTTSTPFGKAQARKALKRLESLG